MRSRVILLLAVVCSSVMAGGWDNSLIGARSAGIGTAFVGIANDASAIYYNAAGLAFAPSKAQFILCGKSYHPTHTYINSIGEKATSEIDATLFEMFTYYRLSNRWTLGFGIFTPYAGGGMQWHQDEIGYSIEGAIGTISFSPTVTLKIFPQLAVGVNMNYYYIVSEQNISDPAGKFIIRKLKLPGDLSTDFLSIDNFRMNAEENGTEYSFTGSIFYKPNDKLSLGFAFHGPTNVALSGASEMEGYAQYAMPPLPAIPITFKGKFSSGTGFYLPASYALGMSYHVTPKWIIACEYDYYYWSKLKDVLKTNYSVPVFINDVPLEETGLLPEGMSGFDWNYKEPMGFNDSYYLKIGAEYLYSDRITLRCGGSYDNGKVSKEAYSVTNIDVTKINFLGGFGYHLGMLDINIAGFIQIGKAEQVPASPQAEEYDLDSVGVLASIVRTW
ncbi:hypothetical protein GF337_11525 [candidate division KSB1 bacterium]|nr:hypothetical protein [candidate division KSB1 bacterium]